jgi:hypothetical protein
MTPLCATVDGLAAASSAFDVVTGWLGQFGAGGQIQVITGSNSLNGQGMIAGKIGSF